MLSEFHRAYARSSDNIPPERKAAHELLLQLHSILQTINNYSLNSVLEGTQVHHDPETILGSSFQLALPLLRRISTEQSFTDSKTQKFLQNSASWINTAAPNEPPTYEWAPGLAAKGIPAYWLMLVLFALEKDLERLTALLPASITSAPPAAADPNAAAGTPLPPRYEPDTADAFAPDAGADNYAAIPDAFTTAERTLPHRLVPHEPGALAFAPAAATASFPKIAKPMASYLPDSGSSFTGNIQFNTDDDGRLILSTATPKNAGISTLAQFHKASIAMRALPIYAHLDLGTFHDNIISNYSPVFTMDSILSYELACRQAVHDSPPGTRFQKSYYEFMTLHLLKKHDAATAQQLHALQVQRNSSAASGSTMAPSRVPASDPRSSSAPGRHFPPCQTFAFGNCVSATNGGLCSRDHSCAACGGRSYPSNTCCPEGHRGESVSKGITQAQNRRLAVRRDRNNNPPSSATTTGNGDPHPKRLRLQSN